MKSEAFFVLFALVSCSRNARETKEPVEKHSDVVTILAAGKDLASGELLTADRVVFKKIPRGLSLPSLLTREDLLRFSKRPLKQKVSKGELLLKTFFREGELHLDSRVIKGARAYFFLLKGAMAGTVDAGTRVDIIGVYTEVDEQAKEVISTTILENVLVLGSREHCPLGSACQTTLTVQILQEEAEKLALVESLGQLRVTVRNPKDASRIQVSRITTRADLVRPVRLKELPIRELRFIRDAKSPKSVPRGDKATPPMKPSIRVK